MTQTKQSAKQQQKQEAIALLRETLKPGSKVYTILRSVSRSGMTRHISTVINTDAGILDITHYVALALEYSIARDGGLVVGGCGMDMGFAVVHSLSYAIHPEGFDCIAKPVWNGVAWIESEVRCPSADHSNGTHCPQCNTRHRWNQQTKCSKCGASLPHNAEWHHKTSGYSLIQQWM